MTEISNQEKLTSSKRIYGGKVINLRVDTVVLPNGKPAQREIVEHRGAVAMVPLTGSENVILVRQWRTPAQEALLEIPAGTLEIGEDPGPAAHRELTEEINRNAGRMTKLFESYMAPGYTTELIRYYLAQDLTDAPGQADDDEFLDIEEVSLSAAVSKIESGEIRDAKSICGLLFVERMRREGRLS